jgi:hypothetical protein
VKDLSDSEMLLGDSREVSDAQMHMMMMADGGYGQESMVMNNYEV